MENISSRRVFPKLHSSKPSQRFAANTHSSSKPKETATSAFVEGFIGPAKTSDSAEPRTLAKGILQAIHDHGFKDPPKTQKHKRNNNEASHGLFGSLIQAIKDFLNAILSIFKGKKTES
jgi:hypothetical protein